MDSPATTADQYRNGSIGASMKQPPDPLPMSKRRGP
jgi:hypothetical protein